MTVMRMLAISALLAAATAARGEYLTYTFDDSTFQGWEYVDAEGNPFPVDDLGGAAGVGWLPTDRDFQIDDRGWNLAQGSSVHGIGEIVDGEVFPQRIPNPRVIPEPWDNRDCLGGLECLTQILKTPTFRIDELGPISVDMIGGQGQGVGFNVPFSPSELSVTKDSSGYQGFALYDVEEDIYVEWGASTLNNDGEQDPLERGLWETVEIPQEFVQLYVGDGRDYQLHIFDSYSGGWGWIGFDTVRLPIEVDDFQYEWTGADGSTAWTNAGNWNDSWEDDTYFDVPIGGEVYINGPAAGPETGPLISEGMSAKAGILISSAGEAYMSMTGGELELNDWGMWWGDGGDNHATFDMSGGVINFTGDPGIMEMGWQSNGDIADGKTVSGTWNMTGGEVNAKGMDLPAKNASEGASATVNLHGGVINVGMARDGINMQEGGAIDLRGFGTLVYEGEQPQVDDYIANGWITAFGGELEIRSVTADGFTSLTAMNITGDYSGDGLVDLIDFNMLKEEFGGSDAGFAPGSSNEDGVADLLDFNDLKANFGASVTAVVPEPGSLTMMVAGGLVGLGLIRRR